MFLRRLKKSKSLRMVNLLGLSVIFSCLLLSFAYIKKELSYDRFHEKADRIVRLGIQFDAEPVDGRIFGFEQNDPLVAGIPGIEGVVRMQHVDTGVLLKDGKPEVANNFFFASPNFFEVFSFDLLQGEKSHVLDSPEKAVVSERYARQLFGDESPIGKEMKLSGRKFPERTVFVSGVFADFPETSHFHTDLIVNLPEGDNWYAYVYLLLHSSSDISTVEEAIAMKMGETYKDSPQKASPAITALTDIHLHSRQLRELEPNGNIHYIYLIAGANLLLLFIVLFNLWLNAGLIFSFNRKYYQLLRLNGASSSAVVKDESLLALVLGLVSIGVGGAVSFVVFPQIHLLSALTVGEVFLLGIAFLAIAVGVSLLPVVFRLSSTMFKSFQNEVQPSNFTLSKVKYLLIAQYCIVMFIVIISFGITKQINMIKTSQVGGKLDSILVMKEQPEGVQKRYGLLKSELSKYPEIKLVTSAMQLPGSAIRDGIGVWKEGEAEADLRHLPLLVVGDDFLPFFSIRMLAGRPFAKGSLSYEEELKLAMEYRENTVSSTNTEEYVLNRKALEVLGFDSPEEAIGKRLYIRHGSLDYIDKGQVVGVVEEFNYTTTYEASQPQLIVQRKSFQHCIMVHLSSDRKADAVQTFNQVWDKVNPDYPANYSFLQDIYGRIYYNELNAEALTRIFSLLCLVIANLGLVIIMAFVIKRKTKEIGIRKVNGATPGDIVRMLNNRFVAWIGMAFVIALPVSYYVMERWLQSFAHKTPLDWWIFALSGLLVLLLSVVSISLQSWHAASLNPVKSLRNE